MAIKFLEFDRLNTGLSSESDDLILFFRLKIKKMISRSLCLHRWTFESDQSREGWTLNDLNWFAYVYLWLIKPPSYDSLNTSESIIESSKLLFSITEKSWIKSSIFLTFSYFIPNAWAAGFLKLMKQIENQQFRILDFSNGEKFISKCKTI